MPLNKREMEIFLSRGDDIIADCMGKSDEDLVSTYRPHWVQIMTELLHYNDECPCQNDGKCFKHMTEAEKRLVIPDKSDFSLKGFIDRFNEAQNMFFETHGEAL